MTLSGLVEKSASTLGTRFGLVSLVPTLLLVLIVFALVAAGAPAAAPKLQVAMNALAQYDTAQGLFLIVVILTLALVFQPFQILIVRFLEGYWGSSKLGNRSSSLFVKLHQQKRDRLKYKLDALQKAAQSPDTSNEKRYFLAVEAGELSEWIYRHYPTKESRLLPTRLGNVLRAAEDRAGEPYGLDVITLWPRFYAILPERMASIIDDQRNQLDIAARFCATFGVVTLVSVGLLYEHGWWLILPAVTIALSWLCYRGAIVSALSYGVSIRTAVDLHRFDLLYALHLPLPENPEAEKKINKELSDFLRQGAPMGSHYKHPD